MPVLPSWSRSSKGCRPESSWTSESGPLLDQAARQADDIAALEADIAEHGIRVPGSRAGHTVLNPASASADRDGWRWGSCWGRWSYPRAPRMPLDALSEPPRHVSGGRVDGTAHSPGLVEIDSGMLYALTLGPTTEDNFSEEELEIAWEHHRERLMAQEAEPPFLPGHRPWAWWYFEAGREQHLTPHPPSIFSFEGTDEEYLEALKEHQFEPVLWLAANRQGRTVHGAHAGTRGTTDERVAGRASLQRGHDEYRGRPPPED